MLEPRIQQHFFESADLSYQAAEAMARPIGDAAQAIVDCITSGGRVWVHGRGVAQAPAQLLGAALSGRFERDRPGLAAMVLAVDPLLLSTPPESSPTRPRSRSCACWDSQATCSSPSHCGPTTACWPRWSRRRTTAR